MRPQRLPPSLREAANELAEKIAARTAILTYERAKPADLKRPAEQALFEARLARELHNLEELWVRVYAAWSSGAISIAHAATILRLPPTALT